MASYFTFKNAIPKSEICKGVSTVSLQTGSEQYEKCVYNTKINAPGMKRLYHPDKLLHGENPALLFHIIICLVIPYMLLPFQYYLLHNLKSSSFNLRHVLTLRLSQFIPIIFYLFFFLYYFFTNNSTFIITDHFILAFVCFLISCVKLDLYIRTIRNNSSLIKWKRRLNYIFLFEFVFLYHWTIICGFVKYFTGYPIFNEYNNKVGGRFEITCEQCWGHLIPSYALFIYGFLGFFIRTKEQRNLRIFSFTSVFSLIIVAAIWLGSILGYKNMFGSMHFLIAFIGSCCGVFLIMIYFIKKSIFLFFDYWVTLIFLGLTSYLMWMHAMMQSMKSTYLGVTHGVDAFIITTSTLCFLGRNYSFYLARLHYICIFMLSIWLALSCEQMGYTVNTGYNITSKTELFFVYSFYTIVSIVLVILYVGISDIAKDLFGKQNKYDITEGNKDEIEPLINEQKTIQVQI